MRMGAMRGGERVFRLEDGQRVPILWYLGLALLRDSAIARMNGVAAA